MTTVRAVGHLVIVGAGIGGLSLALSLHARGVQVTVFERADELREVGAAVALSANGLRLLEELDLLGELEAVGIQPTELVYWGWRDDRRVAGFTAGSRGSRSARTGPTGTGSAPSTWASTAPSSRGCSPRPARLA
ncbi:hypothetical protein AFB00_30390 (plasmid) [Pseudonocardia sp. HH130630-07]|nr:hypothetical protein AFB00_30390 [Pseudonocardia sp. HH130630-07]